MLNPLIDFEYKSSIGGLAQSVVYDVTKHSWMSQRSLGRYPVGVLGERVVAIALLVELRENIFANVRFGAQREIYKNQVCYKVRDGCSNLKRHGRTKGMPYKRNITKFVFLNKIENVCGIGANAIISCWIFIGISVPPEIDDYGTVFFRQARCKVVPYIATFAEAMKEYASRVSTTTLLYAERELVSPGRRRVQQVRLFHR
ncbi:hypothetical protein XH79_21670 [Bradyrhizobium sp. CCBAU 45389]|nr:hypothetical protein [Bradyrhizobium sp. CCBAU 45389]